MWSSDDRAEEAEAADWPAGTPSALERQPSAAGMRSKLRGLEAAPRQSGVWMEAERNVLSAECESNLKR